ncbi:MAG TPA: SAM-dependent methyltransferase [Candidatus Ozemobacteraceae bacterium]|nr:SAM-dependent methyltransferase [Candidatus Ozemobacteraceae bacterium]
MASDPRLGFLCGIGWEQPLIDELLSAAPACEASTVAPGLVTARPLPALLRTDTIFARNRLPEIVCIRADGARELAQGAGEAADALLDTLPHPWTAQFSTPDLWTCDSDTYAGLHARAGLVAELFEERMRRFRKRAFERFRPWQDIAENGQGIVVTGVLTRRDELWVSVARVMRDAAGLLFPAPWPGPDSLLERDPMAPCRSYYKLEEAWLEAGTEPGPGQTFVDIGAAPGGWTWSALKRGAKVVAVDAADLESRIAAHPNCDHRRDNGYEFLPDRPVDWLLCDMIVRPLATLGLVERWLEAGQCRGFVVNLKFRGKEPASILAAVRSLADRFHLDGLRIRHLFHDRNEITLISPPPGRAARPARTTKKRGSSRRA